MDTTIPVLGVAAVIALAMGFNYTNGFHDAANAIATSVSTRALTPRVALAMAAVANLFGAFFGSKVAATIGSGIIEQPEGVDGLWLVAAALVGAIGWNLLDLVVRPALVLVARPHRRSRWRRARRRRRREVGRHLGEGHHPDDRLTDSSGSSSATSS